MNKTKTIILRTLFTILLLITFITIFRFSSQDSEISGGVSTKAMTNIINILPIENSKKPEVIKQCEPILRKIAHFTVYTCVGIWSCALLSTYKIKEGQKIIYSGTIGFIYACTDEFHQSLTPGRGPSFMDVLLDTTGVLFGCLLVLLIIKIYYRIKKNSPQNTLK